MREIWEDYKVSTSKHRQNENRIPQITKSLAAADAPTELHFIQMKVFPEFDSMSKNIKYLSVKVDDNVDLLCDFLDNFQGNLCNFSSRFYHFPENMSAREKAEKLCMSLICIERQIVNFECVYWAERNRWETWTWFCWATRRQASQNSQLDWCGGGSRRHIIDLRLFRYHKNFMKSSKNLIIFIRKTWVIPCLVVSRLTRGLLTNIVAKRQYKKLKSEDENSISAHQQHFNVVNIIS